MTQAKPKFQSIEDYLDYDDGTDTWYELADGELIDVSPENPLNATIAMFLVSCFLQLGIPPYRLGIGHQFMVSSSKVTARQPDLIVHTEESAAAILSGTRILMSDMPSPLLVVEVVSSSDQRARKRDYIEKRNEYAMRGIPEYWMIDPKNEITIVLFLDGNEYQEIGQFRGSDRLISPTFPELQLTTEQILTAGR